MRAHARAKLNQKFMNNLTEMGFTKSRAELALLETNNGGVEVAIEWLLQADQNKEREAQAMREWDLYPPAKAAAKAAEVHEANMSAIPKRVVQLSEILAVAAGTNHTVVACMRGVYAFGCNTHGQLGLGNLHDSHVPLRVKALSHARDAIVSVAAGQCHTLFVSDSSRVYAAGSCDLGQFAPVGTSIGGASYGGGSLSGGGLPSGKRALHATPVRVQLPFLGGHNAAAKAVLHEAKAGGHASVFLIRAVDDPVRAPPQVCPAGRATALLRGEGSRLHVPAPAAASAQRSSAREAGRAVQVVEPPASLMEHLESVLGHAETEIRDILAGGSIEVSRPPCLKPMRACINMVYGNATALCAAFGLPSTPSYAENLNTVTTRILDLYSPDLVGKRVGGSTEKAVAFKQSMEVRRCRCRCVRGVHACDWVWRVPGGRCVSEASTGRCARGAMRPMQAWSKEIREDMKKAYIKIVEDIQVHVKQLAFSERAMLLLVRPWRGSAALHAAVPTAARKGIKKTRRRHVPAMRLFLRG